ncbi:MAG: DUF2189 domain-containing protein [Sedimenticola sp.]|uniref:DUF2189 domain-containing protein n=1 Tax=Sedimenticola thiotaurini TaxID=1543721 RepID=A0A558CL03_9GAMM|nr:DUF2189 domain-containing protein [Sedimenticola sp.]MCW8946386.1 DUF2189 domain-containing protein [Sedimenticola sp.]MCW8949122.1 DUF2189 domain-containing protein [Sedimenticola sp.]MCW8976758.1 DUF2189 domain-containing protein [Sedimenticola sp.]TVT49436.1 MAG: DUF2189 domain-containing protein [Sedimenticola thiotaurini]
MTANNSATTADGISDSRVTINRITLDHPWQWIASGWRDIKAAPLLSLSYGLLFVLSSFLLSGLFSAMGMLFFVPALTAGFFLVSPLLAMGLYETSRTLGNKKTPLFLDTLFVWKRAPFNLLVMGLVLMMGFLIWMLLANVVFALFFFGITPDFSNALNVLFLSGDSPAFMGAGLLVGSIIALIVFSISVVSVPMIIDRNTDAMEAIVISTRCVLENPRPLLLWAALIVMFVGMGLFTFFLGLMVFMPLIGHASWHAYKDLVKVQ